MRDDAIATVVNEPPKHKGKGFFFLNVENKKILYFKQNNFFNCFLSDVFYFFNLGKQGSARVRPFVCNLCDRVFTLSTNLNRHKRTQHSAQPPHVCAQCDFSCVRADQMQLHVRHRHEGLRYQCMHCDFLSAHLHVLKVCMDTGQ